MSESPSLSVAELSVADRFRGMFSVIKESIELVTFDVRRQCMPDRFDFLGPSDLEASLRLVMRFCKLANPETLSKQQQQQVNTARGWLAQQHAVVRQWLDGTLQVLDSSMETPPATATPTDASQSLQQLGETVGALVDDTLRLAHRKDAINSLQAEGRVEPIDFARHIVRIACCATIDRGWTWEPPEISSVNLDA